MNKLTYIILLLLVLGLGFVLIVDNPADFVQQEAEEDEDDADGRLQLVEGSLTVQLTPETQELAGIDTIAVEKIQLEAEDKAFATAMDIRPLVELRARYRNSLAQQEIAKTSLRNSALNLDNLEQLNAQTTNVSKRELQKARAIVEQDKAQLDAEQVQLQNIREEMLQRWGNVLTEWALKQESELFDRLLKQKDYLVMLSLRPEQKLTENTAFVYVNRTDDRLTARKAYIISVAPYSEANLQGETYYLRTNAEKFRIGMRLHVWLPGTGFSGVGIAIPESAIVWYAGKAWAYVQIDETTFSRRSLDSEADTGKGWLVNKHFEPGEQIVISGAQTLLSEEFKWAIPDEDDD